MKRILLLLNIFISLNAYCGDWDLFPLNQKSYFIENQTFGLRNVAFYRMDSIKLNTPDTILYFRKNLNMQGAGSCYVDTLQSMNWMLGNIYYIDSLIQSRDTVYYYSPFSTFPFYFLPKAALNQSWTITSSYINNDYDQIVVTCSGLSVETFLGITDSVKTFRFTPNGVSANQIPVDSFTMKLSKNHGLITTIPFFLFLVHPSFHNFFSYKLIGFDSSGTKYGYQQPVFSDYFHLHAGDILLWERHYTPAPISQPEWSEFYLDSITQVFSTNDSVVYTFDRTREDTDNVITHLNGMSTTYTKSKFENIIAAPPNWIGIGNNKFGPFFVVVGVLYWRNDFLELSFDTITGDTISSYYFYSDASYIDTVNCMPGGITDTYYAFGIDTRAGITKYCFVNFNSDCTTLIGSRINGQQNGNITLSIDEYSLSKEIELKIYPNPSTDIINIKNIPKDKKADYEIFNSVGQLFMEGIIQENKIETVELKCGLYFIRIITDKNNLWGKFIKE